VAGGEEARRLTVGVGSVTWRYASDPRLFLGALAALLLQVAHPTVAAGVRDHSDFEARPWRRLYGTVDWVNLMVYGGFDAVEVGERLRRMHRRVRGVNPDGSRYHALEPAAFAWVHATLVWSIVTGQRSFGSGLRTDEVHQLYREWLGLGRLIGVRDRDLPADWDGFLGYFDDMVSTGLEHTGTVDTVLRAAARPARPLTLPPWTEPLWRVARTPMTGLLTLTGIGTTPPALREQLGLRWTARQESALRAVAAGSRALTPVLPEAVRVNGPAYLRSRRAAIVLEEFAPASYRTQ
jgi:uncharacterized protein (DUF2236 family)